MSQSAASLVEAVKRVGGSLVSEAGRLKVSAPKPLPASLLDDLRHNKTALISYLKVEPPSEWAAAVAQLQRMNCPTHVTEERWQQVRSDAARLLDWAGVLEDMGWTPQDTFGRDELDRKSLAWLVQGQRIGPVTKIAAVLLGTGGLLSFVYRRVDSAAGDPISEAEQ